jgi:magnesium transporter
MARESNGGRVTSQPLTGRRSTRGGTVSLWFAMATTALVFDGTRVSPVDLSQARKILGQAPLVWIDADSRAPEVDDLLSALELHPLTVEDVFETRSTPKVEDFGRYLYIRAHGVTVPGGGAANLKKEELDIVVGSGWVFTHHPPQMAAVSQVRDDLLRAGRAADPGRIAHLLLDRLVDQALPAMDAVDDALDALEKASLSRIPRRTVVPQVLALRSALHRFRRAAVHQREALLRIARGEFQVIPREQLPFFRDVYDHAVRLADLIDDARDMLSGVLEAHLSMVSNRLNEIMKVLTMTATVFLPISFIASVYGMNFERMPELHSAWGYPAVLAAMAATAGGFLWWFKRRGWMD